MKRKFQVQKFCNKCNLYKDLNCFYKKLSKNSSICSECSKKYQVQYRNKFPWKITFLDIKRRCNNSKNKDYKNYGGRGIKCLINEEQVKQLWFRDKAYEMKKPSIDRINNDENYCFDNCQFIELSLNSNKRNQKIKRPILQYDLNNNFIREWDSLTSAINQLKLHSGSLWCALNGRYKSTSKYIWKYKNEKQ